MEYTRAVTPEVDEYARSVAVSLCSMLIIVLHILHSFWSDLTTARSICYGGLPSLSRFPRAPLPLPLSLVIVHPRLRLRQKQQRRKQLAIPLHLLPPTHFVAPQALSMPPAPSAAVQQDRDIPLTL